MENVGSRSYRGQVEALIPLLRQTARALVDGGRLDEADDLVHDVLTTGLRNERNWLGEDVALPLFTRLIAVSRLKSRSGYAERKSAPGMPVQSGTSAGRSFAAVPAHGAAGGNGPLGSLPANEREALALVVLGRLDYPVAAQALGIPVGTLVTRVIQARDRLGDSLETSPAPHKTAAARHGTARPVSHLRLVKS